MYFNQKRHHPIGWRRFLSLLIACLLFAVLVSTARAHTRVEVGPYAIVVGWVNEPPIVGERNAILVEISENEVPVTGAEATLDAELMYGDRTFRVNLNPAAEPGVYTAELFPTVRGQYALRLFGSLEETTVDETMNRKRSSPPPVFNSQKRNPICARCKKRSTV